MRAQVRQEHAREYGHCLMLRLLALDAVGELRFDRVAVGHLDRRREHVRERQLAVLGEHHHEAAGRARRDRGERPVLRRIVHALATEELRRRAGRRDAEAR